MDLAKYIFLMWLREEILGVVERVGEFMENNLNMCRVLA